jgi:hypothetical protein
MWDNIFLYKVYKRHKGVFFAVVIFFFLTFFFNLKTATTTPFIVFHMFSYTEKVVDTFTFFEIYSNGELVNIHRPWQERQRFFIQYNLQHYLQYKENNYKDTITYFLSNFAVKHHLPKQYFKSLENKATSIKQFPDWLYWYVSNITNTKNAEIKIYKHTISIDGKRVKDNLIEEVIL